MAIAEEAFALPVNLIVNYLPSDFTSSSLHNLFRDAVGYIRNNIICDPETGKFTLVIHLQQLNSVVAGQSLIHGFLRSAFNRTVLMVLVTARLVNARVLPCLELAIGEPGIQFGSSLLSKTVKMKC